MHKRMYAILCVFILMLVCVPASSAAAAGYDVVRIGYYENEVFQEGASEGAIRTGYAYEYYRKISEYTGWKYEYVYGEFGDLYKMLEDGDIDMMAGLAYREDREKVLYYPDLPMGNETYDLVKHASSSSLTTNPKSLNGKSVGVLDSAMVDALEKYLKKNHIKADVRKFKSNESLLQAFDSGELDLVAAESDGTYGRDDAEVLLPFGKSDYYLCVSRERPDLLRKLNEAQSALSTEEPNYLYSLRNRYYSSSISARAFSDSERAWIRGNKQIVVGYLENYLPYSGTDDEGRPTGLVKDMVPEMLARLGLTEIMPSYRGFKSYDDMIKAMSDGHIDVAFPVGGGLYFSEENGMYQSLPVTSASTQLVHKGEFSEDMPTHFAVNENNRMQYYFVKTEFPEAEISLYPSIDDCLEAVLKGEVSCTTLNGLRANDILKNKKYKDLELRQLSVADDRCFGVEIGNEGLLKLINRGINVVGTDYAQHSSYKYMAALYSYSVRDMIEDNMALFGSLIVLIGAVIIFLLVRDSRRTKKQMKDKETARAALEEKNEQLEASRKELSTQKDALKDALDAAEHANRAKTTFLNNMSHDIRTPMNAIVGFSALAESHIDDKEQVKDYLEKISVSSGHLLSLINDVLDMSRIESGKITLDEADIDLPDVIGELVTIIQVNADEKKIGLSVDTDGIRHRAVAADKLRLDQILLNLLSNAIKFTPEGGRIWFRVFEKEQDEQGMALFRFIVKDNGIGMSDEFRKTIFEAFTREKTSTVSGIQGTGLGLAITKNLVEMMGGTIEVDSAKDKGSEFTVDIPLKIISGVEKQEEKKEIRTDFTGKRVLLAEDNEMNQMIADAILKDAGLEVDIAGDGEAAVQKMKNHPAGYYDIILMDIQMPKMDGYEAAKEIRSLDDPEKAGVPIVAVTANAFEEDRKVALEAGMNGYLAKPYDIPKIMEALSELIK